MLLIKGSGYIYLRSIGKVLVGLLVVPYWHKFNLFQLRTFRNISSGIPDIAPIFFRYQRSQKKRGRILTHMVHLHDQPKRRQSPPNRYQTWYLCRLPPTGPIAYKRQSSHPTGRYPLLKPQGKLTSTLNWVACFRFRHRYGGIVIKTGRIAVDEPTALRSRYGATENK